MKKELCIKQIYDDFISKIVLTDNEKDVLELYIKDTSIIAIAGTLGMGTTTVSRIIADLKLKYNNYKKLELSKLEVFK